MSSRDPERSNSWPQCS